MKPVMTGGRFFKVLACLFIILLIFIVIIANRGEGDRWWPNINNLRYGDKLGHVCLAGILCLLCNLAFIPRRIPFLPSFISHVTFILIILVSLDEFSQAYISTRNSDWFDWLADLAGLTLGQIAAWSYRIMFKPLPTTDNQ